MTWAKLDDGFFRHPKARAAGKDGRALFIAGLCWAASHLTDGFIAAAELGLVAAEAEVRPQATVRRLVEIGWWVPAEGGWWIHDYLDFNPTAEEEKEKRRKRAESGRRGGQRSRPPGSKTEAKPEANASANSEAKEKQIGTPSPSPTDVVTPPEPLQKAVDNPVGEGSDLINDAVQLAATRYGNNQVDQGKGHDADGLARWWLQENAAGARIRAAALIADHDLTVTQLADALGSHNPTWLRAFRRRPEVAPEPTPDDAKVQSIQDGIRRRLAHPNTGGSP